jgi:hypothetical protein
MTNPEDYRIYEINGRRIYDIALSFFRAGITGMGADHDYQSGDLHVDIANIGNPRADGGSRPPYWGDDGNDNFTTASALEFVRGAWVAAGNAPP